MEEYEHKQFRIHNISTCTEFLDIVSCCLDCQPQTVCEKIVLPLLDKPIGAYSLKPNRLLAWRRQTRKSTAICTWRLIFLCWMVCMQKRHDFRALKPWQSQILENPQATLHKNLRLKFRA